MIILRSQYQKLLVPEESLSQFNGILTTFFFILLITCIYTCRNKWNQDIKKNIGITKRNYIICSTTQTQVNENIINWHVMALRQHQK